MPEYSESELMEKERSAFGFNVQYHFLNAFHSKVEEANLQTFSELEEEKLGTVIARLNRKHEIRTKKGDRMAFVTLEDQSEEIEAVLFPKQYEDAQNILHVKQVYVFYINKQLRNGKMNYVIENVVKL